MHDADLSVVQDQVHGIDEHVRGLLRNCVLLHACLDPAHSLSGVDNAPDAKTHPMVGNMVVCASGPALGCDDVLHLHVGRLFRFAGQRVHVSRAGLQLVLVDGGTRDLMRHHQCHHVDDTDEDVA